MRLPYAERPLSDRLDEMVDRAIAERRIVGAVVLVARDGAPAYRRAAGLADREAGVAMRTDAIFRLASVTKPIVSAALMKLVEDGRVGLDDPVTRHLPDFRPRLPDGSAPAITLHQLLTHTSGLGYRFREMVPGPYDALNVSDGLDQPGLGMAENLRRLAEAPLLFAPGTGWGYSLGIDVLGAVIERVLDRPLPEAVRTLVTGPLGMTDTEFRVVDPARLAAAYADGTPEPHLMIDGIALPVPPPLEGGAVRFAPSRIFDAASYPSGGAGMAGTADDILHFFEAIRSGGGPILKPGTVKRMMAPQIAPELETRGPGWSFGYGWAVLADQALAGTPHATGSIAWGGVYGHSWFVDPVRKLSVVALTNTAFEGMNGAFTLEIRDAVYGVSEAGAERRDLVD